MGSQRAATAAEPPSPARHETAVHGNDCSCRMNMEHHFPMRRPRPIGTALAMASGEEAAKCSAERLSG